MNSKTYTVDEAKRKLEHYCAYQERCHKDVVEKLKKLGMIPIAIDEIVYQLIKNNYLNEERFAKSFARGKFRIKNWGKLRITRGLKFRQISDFNIKSALKEFTEDEYLKKLYEISEKKLNSIANSSKAEKKKKLISYLQYRGWENQLIFQVINDLVDF